MKRAVVVLLLLLCVFFVFAGCGDLSGLADSVLHLNASGEKTGDGENQAAIAEAVSTPASTPKPTPAPTPVPTPSQGSITDRSGVEPVTRTYVLNTNTKKFHYPSCRSVDQMKDKNKSEYTGTREEIINMGYVPCKNCNP